MATSVSSEASSAAAPGGNSVPAIRITGITKHFGDVEAVRGVDLDIIDGEFFSMLGPSGSGKTTMLRMIAGFELPTTGRIELAGRDVTKAPPFERDVNTVFQDYALFPHMTVEENVAYGLRVKRVGKKERTQRAHEALERVQLAGYEARRPGQLSGGQRQRVALARALVNRPKVLLLDEPLGALDLKLRQQMQIELKAIQRDVGITFVFVTHDQEEALTMSDRVAVFNAGRIEQVDTAVRLYEKPETEFVAAFVGSSNLVEADLASRLFDTDGAVAIRPERLHLSDRTKTPGPEEGYVDGIVSNVVFLGPSLRVSVATIGGGELEASVPNTDGSADPRAMVGREVRLIWRKDQVRAVETG